MSDKTKIEWADSTFNPWMGCTKVSPACDHCYAERDTNRFGRVNWGAGQARVRTMPDNWKKPERWNAKPFYECPECRWRGDNPTVGRYEGPMCFECGRPDLALVRRRVFCASLGDWLDNEAPIEWLVDLLDLIRRTPNLDWLLLTKRIGNFDRRVRQQAMFHVIHERPNHELESWLHGWQATRPPHNVWLGATVVTQEEADRDIPKLLRVPARVRFLSIEPMLGPINLTAVRFMAGSALHVGDEGGHEYVGSRRGLLRWVICGGESGPHARPMHPDWVRSLRDQCEAAGVPFLFKQWGEWALDDPRHHHGAAVHWFDENPGHAYSMVRIGKLAAGRTLDGRTHDGVPG